MEGAGQREGRKRGTRRARGAEQYKHKCTFAVTVWLMSSRHVASRRKRPQMCPRDLEHIWGRFYRLLGEGGEVLCRGHRMGMTHHAGATGPA